VPFPETPPVNRMVDYDELRGYLHSDDLRWSYGAVRGRNDPNAALAAEPVPALVRDAAAAGFAGIYVDRFGYVDQAAKLEGELATALGTKPLVSDNGRLAFYELP
jgi:phosphoglycerol transferase